jgi:hypothetical protein
MAEKYKRFKTEGLGRCREKISRDLPGEEKSRYDPKRFFLS